MTNTNVNINNNNGVINSFLVKDKESQSKNKARRQSFKKIADDKLGETRVMNCGEIAFIVEYVNARDITVQFKSSGELVKCEYGSFKKGNVKSHFTPSVFGIGIVGLEPTKDSEGNTLKSYTVWTSMLCRCYSAKYQEKNPTYVDCSVCEEWLYYPNFKKWFDNNYYEIKGQRMCLDKDILHKGNKVYSPDNCVFVSQSINKLFTKRQNDRGDLPIGVYYNKANGKYIAQCNLFDTETKKYKKTYIGYYDNSIDTFNAYKVAKEDNIKVVADYYKNDIPSELYNAMYSYTVDIND